MSLFIVFIIGAVLLGAGGMLSPAWRTAQPRVALSATFCLAILLGGAVFYAEAFGWDTLVVDYLLFALLSGVVLGGTLSTAQARAEARGETLSDRDQGWPGPEDLAFFALAALALALPLPHLPAALGDAGQVIGFHSLAARDGASFHSLAPYASDETVIVAPGLHALSAWLSQKLEQPIPQIQMSLAAVSLFLTLWLAYDFGAELRDKRLGRALAIAVFLTPGLHFSALEGRHAELLSLPFLLAFLLYGLRCLRHVKLADVAACGLMLGAVMYTSLTLSLLALLASAIALVLMLRGFMGLSRAARLGICIGVPLVALCGTAPWLVNVLPHALPITPSPFPADIKLVFEALRGQWLMLPFAVWGIWLCLRRRGESALMSRFMLIWLLLILDLSLTGIVARFLPWLGDLVNAPNIARHGLVLPLAYFAAEGMLQMWHTQLTATLKRKLRAAALPLMAGIALVLLFVAAPLFPTVLDSLRPAFGLPPGTLTDDDMSAMTWLRDNAPDDATLLSSDGAGWLPIVAGKRAVAFRALRYFEWDEFEAERGARADIDFVFHSTGAGELPTMPLRLVFEQGEARVYEVAAD